MPHKLQNFFEGVKARVDKGLVDITFSNIQKKFRKTPSQRVFKGRFLDG